MCQDGYLIIVKKSRYVTASHLNQIQNTSVCLQGISQYKWQGTYMRTITQTKLRCINRETKEASIILSNGFEKYFPSVINGTGTKRVHAAQIK